MPDKRFFPNDENVLILYSGLLFLTIMNIIVTKKQSKKGLHNPVVRRPYGSYSLYNATGKSVIPTPRKNNLYVVAWQLDVDEEEAEKSSFSK